MSPISLPPQFVSDYFDHRGKAQPWVNFQPTFALTEEDQRSGKLQLIAALEPMPASPVSQAGAPASQWLNLGHIDPKVLRQLHWDAGDTDPRPNTLAKGAAKIKGWVKHGKHGIDIRLRRKINAKSDEVLDIHLVPDQMAAYQDSVSVPKKRSPVPAELPDNGNAVYEMPGAYTAQEMPAVPAGQSRDPMDDVLPEYRPRAILPASQTYAIASEITGTRSTDRHTRADHSAAQRIVAHQVTIRQVTMLIVRAPKTMVVQHPRQHQTLRAMICLASQPARQNPYIDTMPI